MADFSQFKSCHSLEWNTELPYGRMNRMSPVFRVRGIEHRFRFFRDSSHFYVTLKLMDEASRSRFRSFKVAVRFEYIEGSCTHLVYGPRTVNCDLDTYFFYMDQSRITSQVEDDVMYCNMMRLIFTFDRADQLALPGLEDKRDDKSVQTSNVISSCRCLERLSDDFSKLLAEDSDHDVVLECGGRTIPAHKNVLRARSSVFAAMLKCDMVEGLSGFVKLQDMDEDTFQAFVRYLYTGTLPELKWVGATKLYVAGDKYAVEGLKQRCAIFLAESLTSENACECLALADAHSDSELKECVIPYVLDEGVPLSDDQWLPFVREYPELAAEVLGRFYQLQKRA